MKKKFNYNNITNGQSRIALEQAAPYLRPGMAAEIKIAICSVKVKTGDNAGNARHFIEDFVAKRAKEKADILFFPEGALSGYMQPEEGQAHTVAETIPGNSVNTMIEAANKYNVYICWGMYEADSRFLGHLYMSQVLVGPEGLVGIHRKIAIEEHGQFHLFHWGIAPGREIKIFELRNGWRVGMTICYDQWFPEIPRSLAVQGADLIMCAGADIVNEWEKMWPTINIARAVENTVCVVFANLAGEYYEKKFFGGRMAVSPNGSVMHPMEGTWDTEGITYATFTAQSLYHARQWFPVLRDRIPEAYRVLIAPALYPD